MPIIIEIDIFLNKSNRADPLIVLRLSINKNEIKMQKGTKGGYIRQGSGKIIHKQ